MFRYRFIFYLFQLVLVGGVCFGISYYYQFYILCFFKVVEKAGRGVYISSEFYYCIFQMIIFNYFIEMISRVKEWESVLNIVFLLLLGVFFIQGGFWIFICVRCVNMCFFFGFWSFLGFFEGLNEVLFLMLDCLVVVSFIFFIFLFVVWGFILKEQIIQNYDFVSVWSVILLGFIIRLEFLGN